MMPTSADVAATLAAGGLPPLPESLPGWVIDSHTHLDTTTEYSGLDEATLVAAAHGVGVGALVQIGCDVEGSRYAVEAAERWENVVAAVALHPNDAARAGERWRGDFAVIEELASSPRVRAIGETGLDYFRTTDPADQRLQQEAFGAHIELARERGLTLAIHDRDAHEDVVAVLDRHGWPERVIFHCFSADAAYAQRVMQHQTWLSFPGNITYNANHHLREALRVTPLDRVLVETDAPFLTPVPFRGKKNASYLIPHTARFIAETRGEPLEDVCAALWRNAEEAYGGPWCARPDVSPSLSESKGHGDLDSAPAALRSASVSGPSDSRSLSEPRSGESKGHRA